ncbi:hypothetical protein QL285_087618 [Trifolium repens]|nr:hypothetical protein QL285_087618 [Trifolium repens]
MGRSHSPPFAVSFPFSDVAFFLRFFVPDTDYDPEGSYSDPGSRGFVFLTFWFFASRSFFHNQWRDRRVSTGDHHPHLDPTGSGPSIVTPLKLNSTSSTSAT